jgi:RNA polymerase sigma-70 factor (ECF subfamily)
MGAKHTNSRIVSDGNTFTAQAWQQHGSTVRRYLRRRLSDLMLVDDLTQETFLRLHRVQPDLQNPAQVRAWLLRTAHNLLVDTFRARRLQVPVDDQVPLPADAPPAWRAFEPCIVPLAQRLPQTYRAALLWDLDGVPQQEIADRQGIGLSGAKSRVQRARGLLAQAFARCCEDFSDPESARLACSAPETGNSSSPVENPLRPFQGCDVCNSETHCQQEQQP